MAFYIDLPPEYVEHLRTLADDEDRSFHGEAIYLLKLAIKQRTKKREAVCSRPLTQDPDHAAAP